MSTSLAPLRSVESMAPACGGHEGNSVIDRTSRIDHEAEALPPHPRPADTSSVTAPIAALREI